MVDLQKLKREWKTFAVGLAATSVGFYDGVVAQGLDWSPIVPEHWRPYAPLAVGSLMLILRKYKDPQ